MNELEEEIDIENDIDDYSSDTDNVEDVINDITTDIKDSNIETGTVVATPPVAPVSVDELQYNNHFLVLICIIGFTCGLSIVKLFTRGFGN